MLKFLNEGTNEIVRIGGRSKEESLSSCFLTNIRDQLKATIERIDKSLCELNESSSRILRFKDVKEFVSKQLFGCLFDNEVLQFYCIRRTEVDFRTNEIFSDWLGLGNLDPSFDREMLRYSVNEMSNWEGFDESDYSCEYEDCFSNDNDFLEDKLESMNLDTNFIITKKESATEEAELYNEQRELDEDIARVEALRNLLNTENPKLQSKNKKQQIENKMSQCVWAKRSKNAYYQRKKELNSKNIVAMSKNEANEIKDLWELQSYDRARYYKFLANKYYKNLNKKLDEMKRTYKKDEENLARSRDEETLNILKQAKVVAMTTTGAAKNQAMLKKLKPKIVVVEEAAEVFESHIISCLTESCEQLILIGDNEQLSPSPNLFKLAKHYNLNVSLFERLVNNKIPKVRLNLQHRMRPEISVFMNNFYPDLIDDDSVKNYENIKGMQTNLFFIDHCYREEGDEDSLSKSNIYEAAYLTRLCDYLLKQKYEHTKITVLVAYGGQLLAIKNKFSDFANKNSYAHPDLLKVRITPIDNYQGEENDIILLSLVRSNINNSIGFLAVSNRVCVALSRAKKGFYIIGNFNHLAQNSKLWSNIVYKAEKENILSKVLRLVCQKHLHITEVKAVEDFDLCINGGCMETCNERIIECGHTCDKKCHSTDHSLFRCDKPCERLFKNCSMNHKCDKKCFVECRNCPFEVTKTLPNCGHEIVTKCSQDLHEIKCLVPINTQLDCGHYKDIQCYILQEYEKSLLKTHHFNCQEVVEKKFTDCNHVLMIKCFERNLIKLCTEVVTRELPKCGHSLKMSCFEDARMALCKVLVDATLPICNHAIKIECYNNNEPFLCKYECTADAIIELKCGHKLNTKCHLKNDKDLKCVKICQVNLPCGHKCSNKCAECISHTCNSFCGKDLICGHKCDLPCGIPCYICTKYCSLKCPHRECKKRCFETCEPCKSQCMWSCKHNSFKCKQPCYLYCNPPKCNIKCNRNLKCNHKCLSLCGESCFCFECMPDAKTPLDKYKTYILLYNCQCIIEAEVLDKHIENESNRLQTSNGFPKCPSCGKYIYYSKRYSALIHQQAEKLSKIKKRHDFDHKASNYCYFISNQVSRWKYNMDKIYRYMENMISSMQIYFLENRFKQLQLLQNIKTNNLVKMSFKYQDFFKNIIDSPMEISNQKMFEINVIGRLLAIFYLSELYGTAVDKTVLNELITTLNSPNKCFTADELTALKAVVEKFIPNRRNQIPSLERTVKPVESIFFQL